jgi:hypothetical protein
VTPLGAGTGNRTAPDPAGKGGVRFARPRVGGSELALAGVLLVGLALRIWLIRAWRPAFLGYPDATGYIDAARVSAGGLLFWNPYRPAGYPLFLTWLHGLDGRLIFAIVVQHAMGLVAALLTYLTVARFARRRWVALLPAAVIALSGSELYLEHAALSETLYTFLTITALWCAARSYGTRGWAEVLWLLVAGVLIGASGPVRSIGVFVGIVIVVWAIATRRGWGRRLLCGSVVAVGIVLSLGGFLVYRHSETRSWGLTATTGETLYARTAVFANCHDFTPPAGTAALCPPNGQPRLGPTAYMFDPRSPALRDFGPPPDPRNGGPYVWAPDSKLEKFAIAAIVNQPWAFAWTTIQGAVKYVAPELGPSNLLEWNHDTLIAQLRNPQIAGLATPELGAYYPQDQTIHHSMTALDDYARAAKVEGPVTAILLLLMLCGFILARGPRRALAGLLGWTTVVMMLAPVALLFYGARYATPAYGPLAAAAAVGLDELVALVSRRSEIAASPRWRRLRTFPRLRHRGLGSRPV